MNKNPGADLVDEILAFDPFANAVGGDREADLAGLGLFAASNRFKAEFLKDLGDTSFNCTLNEQLAIALHEGFKVVLTDTFKGSAWGKEDAPEETYMILWNPEGFLLTIESYNGTGRNMAKLYYNLDLTEILAGDGHYYGLTSTGGFVWDSSKATADRRIGEVTNVWSGNHDAREAFRHTLNKLRSGNPMPVWIKTPFLWLLTYMDTKVEGYDYNAINAERISRLPQEVQDAIKGDPKYT